MIANGGPVQRHGSYVVVHGQALGDLRLALLLGMRVLQSRDGVRLPHLMALRSAVERAIAADGSGLAADLRNHQQSNQRVGIGSVEVAKLLGLGPRRIRQILSRLGGRKVAGVWIFDPEAVAAEKQRREENR